MKKKSLIKQTTNEVNASLNKQLGCVDDMRKKKS